MRRSWLLALAVVPLVVSGHYIQRDAVFQAKCAYVGSNNDDAIVGPGQPGIAHRHDYFGTLADADTTTGSLMAGTAACTFGSKVSYGPEPDDHSAYWAPAIMFNGEPIDMSRAQIDAYYALGKHHPVVNPFPLGLRIIAGNSGATAPQSAAVVRMRCVDNVGGRGPNGQTIPDCRTGPYPTVLIELLFPECWDGMNLDSTDHKSHMAYPVEGACPASHPVKVPKLIAAFRYRGAWQGGLGSEFSSGGVFSAHADFWNAWGPARQQRLVDECLNAVTNCTDRVDLVA